MGRKKSTNPSPPFFVHIGPDGKPASGGGRGIGMHFARTFFPEATEAVRIATAYFSLAGYNLCRALIDDGVQISILVGREEEERNSRPVIDAVVQELWKELGQSPLPLNDAVEDLAQRIRDRKFVIRAARETSGSHKFHCKFYICDDKRMWSGSANYTRNGLLSSGNDEQVAAMSDKAGIEKFIGYYDHTLSNARDLLAEVEAFLNEWLGLSPPFAAYLRILHGIYGTERWLVVGKGHYPSYFQEGVTQQAVRKVKEYGGALLLVATGLGKTIIGAETARRLIWNDIRRDVIVLAPASVHAAWQAELKARNIQCELFDTGLLFRADPVDHGRRISKLMYRLESCDDSTVVIIDEAHRYRKLLQKEEIIQKRNKNGVVNQVNRIRERLERLAKKRSKILLLTATPYGTDTQNINSLLHILPPASPATSGSPQQRWRIRKEVSETAALPVVVVLSVVHLLKMAAQRGDTEEPGERIFIALTDTDKRYLPESVVLQRIGYRPSLADAVEDAFAQGAFRAEWVFTLRYNEDRERSDPIPTDVAQSAAIRAWLSSSREMASFLSLCCETPDRPTNSAQKELEKALVSDDSDAPESPDQSATPPGSGYRFKMPQRDRRAILEPLQRQFASLPVGNEDKFVQLVAMLQRHIRRKHKAILFVKRYSTGYCLAEALRSHFPKLQVACTSRRGKSNKKNGSEYTLESPKKRQTLISQFSPDSNELEGRYRTENYDVLVCTDADGVGLNMQDACVVVNYDLPAAADELFQRAGRVFRMTGDRDRVLYLYTCVPEPPKEDSETGRIIRRQIAKLLERHERAQDIISGSVMSVEPQEIRLATPQDIDGFAAALDAEDDKIQGEPDHALTHIATLEKFRDYAASLELKRHSAKEYNGSEPLVVLLLLHNQETRLILYNTATGRLEERKESAILDLIQCGADCEKVAISAKTVEEETIKAEQVWREAGKISEEDEVIRICSVYLQPLKSPAEAFKGIFR